MKYTLMFLGIIIELSVWECQAATTFYNRQVNRKQKKLIERSMDVRADPCDDFYKYACGNWDQVYAEAGEEYYEPVTMFDYNVNLEMSRAFNRFSLRNKPRFIREAYFYYESCKSLSKYESVKYLMWLKANENFKWPALWTIPKHDTQFDWVLTLSKMRIYGLNDVFIQQVFISKINDTKKFIVDLDKPVADEGFQPLTKFNFEVVMQSLPAPITTEGLDNLWQEIKEFEQKLQELDTIEDVEVENGQDFEKTRLLYVKDLPFSWLKHYVKIILNQTVLDDQMQVYIQNVPYMRALDTLTKSRSQRFLCKYLEIRFLWHLHTNGPAHFKDNDCLASVRSLMSTAMHWQYEQLHPKLQLEYSFIYEIFNDIRKHFNDTIIKNKHGFNTTVIQFLQNKINNMKLRLNNIPRIDTIDTLEKFYEPLQLDAEEFYGNHLKLLRFNFIARRNLLSSHSKAAILDLTYLESFETGSSSSPYFMQYANTVFVPLTLLQLPIYRPGFDDVYKYSSLGFLLAHEMFHGFDDSGLFTDANGSMTLIEFDKNPLFNASFNCLLEINPQVISEKIADVSGLRYAYQAFFDSYPEASNKKIYLYSNEISLSKLFFLNFAQFFCGNSNEQVVALSEHGLDKERVTDALSHFPEFAKEFECKPSHRLYPHETCHLWR